MFQIDISSAFEDLQQFYSCAKCKSKSLSTPVLLKTCRHIFCTRCLVIRGRQQCPQCQMAYTPADVDRGNAFLSAIIDKIKRIDALFPNGDYTFDVDEEEVADENSGALPFAVRLCKDTPKRNHKGETQLHLACKKGLLSLAEKLIASGMDVNCVDWANWTPLHEAVQSGSMECMRLLLAAGCLPNVPAQGYVTPLHQAAEAGRRDMMHVLVAHGADMDAADISGKRPRDICHLEDMERLVVPRTLLFNCDSSKCGPKQSSATRYAFKVDNCMEYLSLEDNVTDLFMPQVLAAILQGVPVIYEKDVAEFVDTTTCNLLFTLIPETIRDAYLKSLHNRCHRLPKLLDGMCVHLPPAIREYKIDNVTFTRDDLHALIEIGGGTTLKRAPTESTVDGVDSRPYHCRPHAALAYCAHYIVYDDLAAPLLMYNMKELRHVSARWLTKCMWHFQLQ